MKQTLQTLLFLFAVIVCFAADETLGEWRDKVGSAMDRRIQILKVGDIWVQRSTMSNGETFDRKLVVKETENKDQRTFLIAGSERGEGCTINRGGDLELFDREGTIRVALKIRSGR